MDREASDVGIQAGGKILANSKFQLEPKPHWVKRQPKRLWCFSVTIKKRLGAGKSCFESSSHHLQLQGDAVEEPEPETDSFLHLLKGHRAWL